MSISELRIPRRLAAIIAADVAGYSRLMGSDEEGTLRLLSERRRVMDGFIQQFGGRIANTAGDSVIAEFASVVAAVECAISIQHAHNGENATLPPGQRIAFRIGIHLGDVLIQDGDVFGGGVNIAARLEQLAEPGGITLSARVKEEIAGKIVVKTENLGSFDLKNIARPVEVWRIPLASDIGPRDHPFARLRRARRKVMRHVQIFVRRRRAAAVSVLAVALVASIAALNYRSRQNNPLVVELRPLNVLADAEAAKSMASALTQRLVNGLGPLPSVRLLYATAENGAPPGNAKYVISGSVAAEGATSTRVNARIVEAASGQVVATTNTLAQTGAPNDMQDEILGVIGEDLSVELNKLRYGRGIETPDRQRALSLAGEARNRIDLRKEPDRAVALFEEASRLDPDSLDIAGWYANALVAIASLTPPGAVERNAYLQKARVILDARRPEVANHRLLIYAQCQLSNYEGRPEAALGVCNQALVISPWSARVHKEIGTAYMQLGQLERALASFTQAERLDHKRSVRSLWETKAGIAALLLGRNQEAVDWFRRAAVVSRNDPWIPGLAAVAYNRLGNTAAAQNEIATFKQLPKDGATKEAVRAVSEHHRFNSEELSLKLRILVREFEDLLDMPG